MNVQVQGQHEPLSVEAVDRAIASGSFSLKFPHAIEIAFDVQSTAHRIRVFVLSGITALCLYDVFLINDWFAVPDVFVLLAVARFGVFTPVLIVMMLLVSRSSNTFWRESAAIATACLANFLPMAIMVFSVGPYRVSYQLGSLLIMMFTAVVQRARFRFAVVGLLIMLMIQSVTTWFSSAFDSGTYGTNLLIFGSATLLLLLAAYFAELSERRGFLFALRGQLLHEEVVRISRTDALTGLFNRRHLADVTDEIWAAAARAPRLVSAVLLDVDQFKAFNDTYGHLEGDTCLRTVSTCVLGAVQSTGSIAVRFGGEEIMILLPDVAAAEACRLAETIRVAIKDRAIAHPVLGDGAVVTASFGIATAMAPDTRVSDLIAAADGALYAAKRAGRDRVRHADALATEPMVLSDAA